MDFFRYIGISLLSLAGVAVWASDPPHQIAQDPGRQYSCYVQLPNGQVEDLSRWCGAFTPQPSPPTATQPETPATSNATTTNNGTPPNNAAVSGQPPTFPSKPQPNTANPMPTPGQGSNAMQDTQDTTDASSDDE